MGEGSAWVTLATNDSYCLGALVLAHSLRRVNTAHPLVILVTPGVTPIMKERLSQVFAEVIYVDVLDSGDAAHLALLARPELGITFTKLHCWSLTQYSKCVFLDADTLVLQNCDELFDREELSAAPDVGWPDCFNSGVFVYRPSNETFNSLVEFAKEKGSFDGGDQGLLNQYFSTWATGDISKHLSFLYNVCSTSFYSYLPALKQYGQNMKIVHFIGQLKPWLENFNWGSRSVGGSGTLQGPLQYWWDIFIDQVHPTLDVAMGGHTVEAASPALYTPPNPPQFPWHRPITPPLTPDHHQDTLHNDFIDPWEIYSQPHYSQDAQKHHHENINQFNINTNVEVEAQRNEFSQDEFPIHHVENHMNQETVVNLYTPKAWYECYTNEEDEQNVSQVVYVDDTMSQDDISMCGPGGSHCGTEYTDAYSQNVDSSVCSGDDWHSDVCQEQHDDDEMMTVVDCDVRPRHPYDNFYLLHQVILGPEGHKRCMHEAPPVVPPPPSPSPPPTPEEYMQSGVAGALSQLSIGSTQSTPAMDEHLRRQGWEAGNIDYMGADAFDNIWAKISQTLSIAPAPSGPAPEPTPAPVTAPAPAPVAPSQTSLPSSRASTESFEQVSSGIVPTVSDISISKPSSLENSSDSSFTAAPSAKPETKETSALTEEKADHKQVSEETSAVQQATPSESPNKPMEKLVCHLKPMIESEPLLTPESELEDAATIAQKIIASEEALSSPIITSATPVTSPPICPIIPQNIKDLIVETAIPDTPPLSGPVSLAQIGIIPSKQVIDDQVTSSTESVPTPNEPKTLVQLTESKVSIPVAESTPEVLKETTAPVECPLAKAPELHVVEKSQIEESQQKSKASEPTAEAPKLAESNIPKMPEPKTPTETSLPKTPEPVVETPKSEVVKETDVPKTPTECVLPKTSEPAKPKADLPQTPTESPKTPEPTKEEVKTPVKKAKKVVKQKSSTETPPKTPDTEGENKKLVCSLKTKDDPPKTVAEVTLPTDLEKVTLPKALEKAIFEPSKEKVDKKTTEIEKKATGSERKGEVTKIDAASKGTPVKKEEPASTPTEEEAAKPKVKKVVKKVPATPKAATAGSEGASKSAEVPVPPPRKKVVKPKEK